MHNEKINMEASSSRTTFSFLSYNIDGREFNFEERLKSFVGLIAETQPDIVVIQEGTRLTYEKLMREMGLLKYKRYLPEIMGQLPVGEMLFSKFEILEKKYFPFQRSDEARGMSAMRLKISEEKEVWACTCQLDTRVALRGFQISEFNKFFRGMDIPIIFGGDTKILEYQTQFHVPEMWIDAWYESGTDTEKYTLDHTKNLLVEPPFKDRPNRVWFRGDIECEECGLLGVGAEPTISSHFGVAAEFEL